MSPALMDMVRGASGAPERMRFVRGWAIFEPGDVIERRGDYSICAGYRLGLADLIWLARTGHIQDATDSTEVQHAA